MECEEGLKVLYEVDSRAGLGGWFERAMAGEGGPALHNGEVQVEMGMEEKDMAQYNKITSRREDFIYRMASLLSLYLFVSWKILPVSGCAVFM